LLPGTCIAAKGNADRIFAKKLIDQLEKKKTPDFIRLGQGSTVLPLVAKFPRPLVDYLLSKQFGLSHLGKSN